MANQTAATKMSPQSAATALVGGIPTTHVDIPILAVFIALFITMAAGHMTIYQRNNRRGHKFLISGLLFGFCMSRILASVMRIAWAASTSPSNPAGNRNVAIVAQVFNNAGILLVYVVNNVLAQRMLRAAAPALGWNRVFRWAHKTLLCLVVPVLAMVIVAVVRSLGGSTDPKVRRVDSDLLRAGQTYIAAIAMLPLPLLALALVLGWMRRRGGQALDKFGSGSWNAKAALLFLTIIASCVEACFRLGTTWQAPRLASNPAWYDSRAAYYCFGFMVDVILAGLFLVGRADKRFHVPNGAEGPGSYSTASPAQGGNRDAASDTEGGQGESWVEKEEDDGRMGRE